MAIDRQVQKRILELLAAEFPAPFNLRRYKEFSLDIETVGWHLAYLEQHGLIACRWDNPISGPKQCLSATMLAKGIDFLEDDGGLSAILGVVTIKFHDDTIKAMVEMRIQESDLPQPDKIKLLDQLKALPAAAVKHLATKLMEKGLETGGAAAVGWLGTIIHSLLSSP